MVVLALVEVEFRSRGLRRYHIGNVALGQGEVGGVQLLVRAGDGHFLHEVLQLADIAGPVVFQQYGEHVVGHFDTAIVAAAEMLEEELGQRNDIFLAAAQGRDVEDGDLEAVVQVTAEFAGLHRLLEVLVRCRDDAHIDLLGRIGTHGNDHAFLKEAQQAGLELKGQFAHFVEENRAAGCGFDKAHAPALVGTGERAGNIAEQLGFDEIGRDTAAIDLDEGLFTAVAQAVDALGHDILAGTGLAKDEDGDIRAGHAAHLGQEGTHGRADEDIASVFGREDIVIVVDADEAVEHVALMGELIFHGSEHTHVAHEVDAHDACAVRIKNRIAVQRQILAVGQLLHFGHRTSGTDDLGVDDHVEHALSKDARGLLTDDRLAAEAGKFFVLAIDVQADGLFVADPDAILKGIENLFYMLQNGIHLYTDV